MNQAIDCTRLIRKNDNWHHMRQLHTARQQWPDTNSNIKFNTLLLPASLPNTPAKLDFAHFQHRLHLPVKPVNIFNSTKIYVSCDVCRLAAWCLFLCFFLVDEDSAPAGAVVVGVLLESLHNVLGDRHETVVNVTVQFGRSFKKLYSILCGKCFSFLRRYFLLLIKICVNVIF